MKIGIFDSGLGGLLITRAIRDALPEHDLVYLGDTLHVPYGRRSPEAVYDLSKRIVDYLFKEQDCQLIIMACNTASAAALRRLQQGYLLEQYPDRRILGVVVPTLETALDMGHERIGLLGTESLIQLDVYQQELSKLNPDVKIYGQAAPLLVPMIEHEGTQWIEPVLENYLSPLREQNIQSLILGCTHYPYLKEHIRTALGEEITLISQDEIIPAKLTDYLNRHPESDEKIEKNGKTSFLLTDITDSYPSIAQEIYGADVLLEKVSI